MNLFFVLIIWFFGSAGFIFLAWGAVLVADVATDVWLKTLDKLADIEKKRSD